MPRLYCTVPCNVCPVSVSRVKHSVKNRVKVKKTVKKTVKNRVKKTALSSAVQNGVNASVPAVLAGCSRGGTALLAALSAARHFASCSQ